MLCSLVSLFIYFTLNWIINCKVNMLYFFRGLKLLIDTINLQDERMQVQGISTLALLSDLNHLHLLYAVFCQNKSVTMSCNFGTVLSLCQLTACEEKLKMSLVLS